MYWTRSFSQIPSLLQSSAFTTFQMIPATPSTRFLRLYCRATQQSHLGRDREPKQGLPPCSMWPQDSRVLAPRFPQPSNSQPVPPSRTPDLFRAMSLSLTLHFCQIKKKKKMDFRKQTIQRLFQQRERDVAIGRTRAPDSKI